MICPYCGAEFPEGTLFCAMCGGPLRDEVTNEISVSIKEQIAIYLRDIGKDELSDAFQISQVSCFTSVSIDPQDNDNIQIGHGPEGSSTDIVKPENSFIHKIIRWFLGLLYTNDNKTPDLISISSPLPDSLSISSPTPIEIRKEVIVMTISGNDEDLTFLQTNSEAVRNGIKQLFRENRVNIDVERIIFTLGESSQSIPQRSVSKIDKLSYDIIRAEQVLDDLIEVGKRICLNSSYNKKTPENKINDSVRDMLSMKGYYEVKDQTRHGISTSGKDSGNVDLLLAKGGNELAIIEALRLKYIDGPYIDLHIRKAIINYNPLGTPTFILAYVNYYYFQSFWNRYYDYIKQYQFPETITVQQDFEEILEPNATTRIAKVVLSKDGYDFPVYFIALKISDE